MEEMYLIFFSDGKKFSLPFSAAKLIVAGEEISKVPDFPSYVLGTIVNDGKVVPVIDLRKRFNYSGKPFSDRDCIIITESERTVGLLCDSVDGFINVTEDKIMPPPKLNEDGCARFLTGAFTDENGKVCYILSPELIVKSEDEDKVFG